MGSIAGLADCAKGITLCAEGIADSITVWHIFFGVCIGVLLGVIIFLVVRCFEVGGVVRSVEKRLHDLEVRNFMDDDESPL